MLIIGLMFTLSMAFYIEIVIYGLLFYTKGNKKIIYFVIGLLLAYGVILQMDENSEIYRETVGRFRLDKERGFAGNSRHQSMEDAKKQWQLNLWMGAGGQNMSEIDEYMADNPYETLATDGIMGTVILYLPFIWLFIACKNREVRCALIILAAGYMQRPFHNNLMHYFYAYMFLLISIYIKNGWIQKNAVAEG